jgi:DNA-binding PadR family transcriptional regulator
MSRAGAAHPEPESLLPLPNATLHILLALADGPRHGYGIAQAVDALSEGRVAMGPGTLYGAIKKLVARGLIEESDWRPDPELDDERRRYYRLAPFGARVCDAELSRLRDLVQVSKPLVAHLRGAV